MKKIEKLFVGDRTFLPMFVLTIGAVGVATWATTRWATLKWMAAHPAAGIPPGPSAPAGAGG